MLAVLFTSPSFAAPRVAWPLFYASMLLAVTCLTLRSALSATVSVFSCLSTVLYAGNSFATPFSRVASLLPTSDVKLVMRAVPLVACMFFSTLDMEPNGPIETETRQVLYRLHHFLHLNCTPDTTSSPGVFYQQ